MDGTIAESHFVTPRPGERADFRPVQPGGLPIFRQDSIDCSIFYAPGYLCVVGLRDADQFEAMALDSASGSTVDETVRISARLRQTAEAAIQAQQHEMEEPFNPECLTLYMNNACNLSCVYCYSDPSPSLTAGLEMEEIAAAAAMVAENCRRKGRPFYAVFHGGGEPVLHRERVEQVLAVLDSATSKYGVELFRYVATNGVMSMEKACWLARRFDLVGLSCDGPADIQDSQRPRWDGRGSSHILERTAHILHEEGCRLHVRTTITPATLHRQAEIADYICQQISPEEIRFEPVYLGGKASAATGFGRHQAGQFVTHFLEAQEIARQHGVPLLYSGARAGSIHGPYCHVFRQVLNLMPGGVATACFKTASAAQARRRGVAIGELSRETGRFKIDHRRVHELRNQLGTIPSQCAGCFNCYHCVRDCPDRCPLDEDAPHSHYAVAMGFRCQVQKALTHATLRETAERLWSTPGIAAEAREKVYGTAILRSVLSVSAGRD